MLSGCANISRPHSATPNFEIVFMVTLSLSKYSSSIIWRTLTDIDISNFYDDNALATKCCEGFAVHFISSKLFVDIGFPSKSISHMTERNGYRDVNLTKKISVKQLGPSVIATRLFMDITFALGGTRGVSTVLQRQTSTVLLCKVQRALYTNCYPQQAFLNSCNTIPIHTTTKLIIGMKFVPQLLLSPLE